MTTPPQIHDHFASLTAEMRRRSDAITQWFKTHNSSNGSNREDVVASFLKDYVAARFFISSGLIFSSQGEFSNQTDLAIVDAQSGTPLYRDAPVPIWLVESAFAAFEIKPDLDPSSIKQAADRSSRFKMLERRWDQSHGQQKILNSLFILWSFAAPSTELAKENLVAIFSAMPLNQRPDMVIVPGRFLFISGSYLDLAYFGQLGSAHRQNLQHKSGGTIADTLEQLNGVMFELKDHSLLVFLHYLSNWLFAAGPRRADVISYLPQDLVLGRIV